MKAYRSNLCTFLGREYNIKILHTYIEQALSRGVLDRYYMFDLTRDRKDQKFIVKEYHRLSSIYKNRVYLVNYQKRKSQFKSNSVRSTIGYWGDFYRYLTNFKDEDIIIKVDDDTLFIDVNELEGALQTRWENKSAFLMHSNCINNGICAYYQAIKNIWRFDSDKLKLFPEGGIAGPLFLWPDLARDCHDQFLNDLSKDYNNINKYKLSENIYFNARVSINFTFILGKDRFYLKDVDEQDEYLISSKIPQNLGRSNMIIGDFVTAHHSYGAQDPLLKEYDFLNRYKKLSKKPRKNNKISSLFFKIKRSLARPSGTCSTIKYKNEYLCPSWLTNKHFTIKNTRTNKFLGIKLNSSSQSKFWRKSNHEELIAEDFISGTDNPQFLFVDKNIRNHNQILTTKDFIKKSDTFPSSFASQFYNENLLKNGINLVPADARDTFLIESLSVSGAFLCSKESEDGNNISYFFQKDGRLICDKWEIKNNKNLINQVLLATNHKISDNKFHNDPQFLKIKWGKNSFDHILPRSYHWTIDKHIWEFIKLSKNIYFIKCIQNYGNEKFLSCLNGDVIINKKPYKWRLIKDGNNYKILDTKSHLYINIDDSIKLNKKPSLLEIKI